MMIVPFSSFLLPILVAQSTGTPATQPPLLNPPATQPVPVVQPAKPAFISDYEITESVRLALTPKLDGKIETEEWDPLSVGAEAETYFQWEPGVLYVAGKVPVGKECVISLDMSGSGWLLGKENLELRTSWNGTAATLIARGLDGTDRNGARWIESPLASEQFKVAGSQEGDKWSFELKLIPIGLSRVDLNNKIGIRTDYLSMGEPAPEAYVPRKTALLSLGWETSKGLPEGLSWFPEYKYRSVPPGENIAIKINFTNTKGLNLKRVEMRTEGLAKTGTAVSSLPFPAFDRKNRAQIAYDTPVASDSSIGFQILRTTLTDDAGNTIVLRSSYLVSDLVIFDVNLPLDLRNKADAQIVRGSITIRSQSLKRLDGVFKLQLPEGWSISKGTEKKFFTYHSRGSSRIPVELITPRGARGVYPFLLKAEIGGKIVERTVLFMVW